MENSLPVSPLSLIILQNDYVLNPYEEMDEDLLRELAD